MTVSDIINNYTFDTDERITVFDTTESYCLRILCKGNASSIDLDTELRGFVGNEEVLSLMAMNDTLYIGIGNPSGR